MKLPFFYILTVILLSGLSTFGQKIAKNDIEGFNNFLGYEKSIAMNKALDSFDKFLINNYPNKNTQTERAKEFLLQLQDSFFLDTTWIFETKANKKILNNWESTGLRKEIWLYGYEEYEPKYNIHEFLNPIEIDTLNDLGELEIDSIEEIVIPITGVDSIELARREREMEERLKYSLSTNTYGEFLYGLAKFAPNDTIIRSYVDSKAAVGDIAPELIIPGLLKYISHFDNPFMKRIVLTEIYYWFMKSDIEKKEK